eukprot:Nk52_evm25s288 gene=Nk52_evmTU25s288
MKRQDSDYPNRNSIWFGSKGIWLAYIVLIAIARWLLGVVPGITSGGAWTLTIVLHNTITMIVLHFVKGTPFDEAQGRYQFQTAWEQIDGGEQYTSTKKFFTIVPILLFYIGIHYSEQNPVYFAINLITLLLVLIAKLPQMHQVRLFGLMKY